MKLIEKIESEQLKQVAPFKVGDTVKISLRVKEGEKERTQALTGLVIARKGRGMNTMFTVRRMSAGYGVERTFPLNAPTIEKIEVQPKKTQKRPRRAKLYHLRNRTGKAALAV